MSRRHLKLIPLILVLALLGGGGYYAYTHYIAPPSGGLGGKSTPGTTIDDGTGPTPTPEPDGRVAKPDLNINNPANAKARMDVLARIERMPNLTSAQKNKLTLSVDKARSMGCILIIPFEAGKTSLGQKESDLLVKATKADSIQKLVEDPTLVLVILGYADKKGDPGANLNTSVDRAQAVQDALKNRCGIQNVIYSVGMGGADVNDSLSEAKPRRVEVWAVFP